MFLLSEEANTFLREVKGKVIVFTNGCFDILHKGHIHYLNQAKSLGDILFIGLNSDKSVRKIKGEERPINSEKDRKYILDNLKAVDFVEIFNEETPLELIKQVRPNVLVKGGDWELNQVVGYEFVINYGGNVHNLAFIEGYSTTNIVEKIRAKKSDL